MPTPSSRAVAGINFASPAAPAGQIAIGSKRDSCQATAANTVQRQGVDWERNNLSKVETSGRELYVPTRGFYLKNGYAVAAARGRPRSTHTAAPVAAA